MRGPKIDYKELEELCRKGLTAKEMADILGRTEATINTALSRIGLRIRNFKDRNKQLAESSVVIGLHATATQFGVSPAAVYTARCRYRRRLDALNKTLPSLPK